MIAYNTCEITGINTLTIQKQRHVQCSEIRVQTRFGRMGVCPSVLESGYPADREACPYSLWREEVPRIITWARR